jgi:hypothetical protein
MAQYQLQVNGRTAIVESWDPAQPLLYVLRNALGLVLGAFFLTEVDEALERLGLFSVRYMDDILALAPTRWKLRQAVRIVNQVLMSLRLAKHPDKTFIGRTAKGFDFLGYHFSPEGLRVATKTVANFVARARQLYEQEREKPVCSSTLGVYVRRWVRWVRAGLPGADHPCRHRAAMPGVESRRSRSRSIPG